MDHTALDRARRRVVEEYRSRTSESARLFERARNVLPGGVSGNLRYFEPYPLYMSGGSECTTTDVDGNDYIDCFLLNGPLLLGHRPKDVLQEISKHSSTGSLVLNPALLVECAELLCEVIPCAERVRFLNSGTEAVLSAVRYARAFTGRSKIIKFFGHYHGQDDQFLVGASVERSAFGAGIPEQAFSCTLTLPFNDIDAVRQAIAGDGDVAAIILDPAMHSGGLWGTTREFLAQLRELATSTKTVLIFDEVITGFRLAPGGAQEFYGVTPDLVTLAKALGAGERIAAVAGRADIMGVVDPQGDLKRRVFQSGTGNDGTAGLAAAVAAMKSYRSQAEQGGYVRLAALGASLAQGLRQVFSKAGIPHHVNQNGSMLQLFFSARPASFAAYASLDQQFVSLFYLALITRGVLLSLPTSNHIYLSFAHGQAEIDHVLATARSVIEDHGLAQAHFEAP